MKPFQFLLLVGLLFGQCATKHSYLASWESEEFNSSQKKDPAIMISPSQFNSDSFRDANGVIHENEDNPIFMNMDTTSLYYRMIRRNRNLPENKYDHQLKMIKEARIHELPANRR